MSIRRLRAALFSSALGPKAPVENQETHVESTPDSGPAPDLDFPQRIAPAIPFRSKIDHPFRSPRFPGQ
jgi:hypothetical protein